MTADEEDKYIVAQANEPIDAQGHFVNNNVSGRYKEETSQYQKSKIDYMDVSPKMVFSVATAMIPFLQNDVWTFWSFNRAHSSIVRIVNISYFKSSTISRKTTRS